MRHEFRIPHERVDRQLVSYDDEFLEIGFVGLSDTVIEANELMQHKRAPIDSGSWSKKTVNWFSLPGFRLALSLVDFRFAEGGEYFDLLPVQLQQARQITIMPDENKSRLIY